ncbi:zinc-binding dehydrogenase [Mycobacterium sp. URHD0025]|uniref:alcohol dehydrogenase catalytic domain-containing protein n=1 Tax=Mycobacterium sp. URHD0025 TaxID=1298864 RepID=UPI0004920668|nr:zinc-binding dehydrogenase [Mycobacterium sp. URHD0025]
MRAAQYFDGRFTVTDVTDPPATGPGQLRIKVAACGICGSDLSMSKDPCRFVEVAAGAGYPFAVFDATRPVVLGHEWAGTVVETGPGVEDFTEGDRVTGLGITAEVGNGMPTIIGYSNEYHGAFGEFIVVDAFWARHVPDSLSLEHAALAEPLHVGEMHMQQSGLTPADTALVIGCGSIGLGTILAAKAAGAHTVIASEPSPKRRELAAKMGADFVVDPNEQDPIALYDELRSNGKTDPADPQGLLIAYECSGRAGTLNSLTHTLPWGSRIQVVASPFAEETIIPVVAQMRQIAINFGHGPYDRAYELVLARLADGEIDAEAIITGRVGLDGLDDAFEALRDPDAHVKILVLPGV